MSEILNFWLFALISQMAPYLMFILVSKSTHPVSLVLSSQNAQCFYISAPLRSCIHQIILYYNTWCRQNYKRN